VATEAERIAGSKKRIARWGEENPEDAKGLASEYLLLAQMLRRLDSFRDIPGGAVAVVIVPVKPEDLRPSRRRKAA
jgi:hypothetical protein